MINVFEELENWRNLKYSIHYELNCNEIMQMSPGKWYETLGASRKNHSSDCKRHKRH